jgi:hypothetical protein
LAEHDVGTAGQAVTPTAADQHVGDPVTVEIAEGDI